MKSLVLAMCASCVVAGCVVAPAPVRVAPGVRVAPPPVGVYVAPSRPRAAPGYVWAYHARYGWGWRHPRRGWYHGWR